MRTIIILCFPCYVVHLLCMSSVGAHIVRPPACGRWWDEIWDKARHAGRWQASSPTDWILGLRQIFRFLHGAMGHRALQIILLSITHFQMSPNLIFLSGAFALRSTIIIHYSLLLILFIPHYPAYTANCRYNKNRPPVSRKAVSIIQIIQINQLFL